MTIEEIMGVNMTDAVDAVLALELLAGLPPRRVEHSPEAVNNALERTYGIRLSRGAPSWRGPAKFRKPEPPAVYIFRAPEGVTAILDADGRLRNVINGRVAVDSRTAECLRIAGWESA